MRKIILIFTFVFSNVNLISAETNILFNQQESYKCRLQAYLLAEDSGYPFGSYTWQWIYKMEKKMCERE